MKIAFVSVFDPTNPLTWSGTPNSILKALVREGADVDVIGPLDRRLRYIFLPRWAASRIFHKAYHADREPLLISSYAREIERRMRGHRYDAILSLETFLIADVNRPEPIVYWNDAVWDLMRNYYFHDPMWTLDSKARKHEQQAMDVAAHAIYSSDWAAEGAVKYHRISRKKLSVIPFGANLDIQHDQKVVETAIEQRRGDVCRLLFLGVDWKRKGGDIALNTARLLNERGLRTELLVAGCAIPGKKPEFAKELGFISKQTPAGRARIGELLKTSHFLMFPTRAECSAIALGEACAYGLPIITADTGGIPTYVREGVNGVRLPLSDSGAGYADHIYRLFRDRDAYRKMALGAWYEYEQRLNWKTSAQALLALLKKQPAPAQRLEPIPQPTG